MTRAPVASREQIQSAMHTLKAEAADRPRGITLQQQTYQHNQNIQRQGMAQNIHRIMEQRFL